MLYTKKLPDGRKRHTNKPLLIDIKSAYTKPRLDFSTTTSVWNVDELIKRRVRDWRRITDEDGHTGLRSILRKDSVFTGTYSVFPIPLMEYIIVRYAGERGNKILDAFAGGPPRAIASSLMGFEYHGVDVREEQIEENYKALENLKLGNIFYHHDDARFLSFKDKFDCAITCPPYYNIEVYSDDKDDISTCSSYAEFNAAMWMCAHSHRKLMKPESFVCIIIGNFRDKKTKELIDFRTDTVQNFKDAGFIFHEEIILKRNFGSAAKRSANAWRGKKLVRIHEFLLVFKTPVRNKL